MGDAKRTGDHYVTEGGLCVHEAWSYVDAHNRFGGRDRVRVSATMKTDGDGSKVENLRGWTAR